MKILPIQEIYTRKFERQKGINGLELHAAGHCAHIGKISPGCKPCFIPDPFSFNILSGVKCNLNCPYCTSDKKVDEHNEKVASAVKVKILRASGNPNFYMRRISFSGGGEPLLYIDFIAKCMGLFHDMEKYLKKRPWYYLYTNGTNASVNMLSRLKTLGFDEIRFHLGATNFSKKVYKNIENAVRYFKAVTVETPSWPPHRDKLFGMLPVIEDIGVKHLNIGEIEVNKFNYHKIASAMPKGEIYQCYEAHLYDGGMVYDIMEEVMNKGYSYSVLDCNGFVKSIQRSVGKDVCHESVDGLCAAY